MTRNHVTDISVEEARAQHRGNSQHFATPASLALEAMYYLSDYNSAPSVILDPGCGDFGVFGWAARKVFPNATIIGLDIEPVPTWPWYDNVICADFTAYQAYLLADIIAGNPPFAKAVEFIEWGMRLLYPGGHLLFVLKQAFWASASRYKNFWPRYYPYLHQDLVLPKRPSWWLYDTPHAGERSTNQDEYTFFHFINTFDPTKDYRDHFLNWNYDNQVEQEFKAATGLP